MKTLLKLLFIATVTSAAAGPIAQTTGNGVDAFRDRHNGKDSIAVDGPNHGYRNSAWDGVYDRTVVGEDNFIVFNGPIVSDGTQGTFDLVIKGKHYDSHGNIIFRLETYHHGNIFIGQVNSGGKRNSNYLIDLDSYLTLGAVETTGRIIVSPQFQTTYYWDYQIDAAFNTDRSAAVPLPGTFWLLVVGLGAVLCVTRLKG